MLPDNWQIDILGGVFLYIDQDPRWLLDPLLFWARVAILRCNQDARLSGTENGIILYLNDLSQFAINLPIEKDKYLRFTFDFGHFFLNSLSN
jgi:hypothetical protein